MRYLFTRCSFNTCISCVWLILSFICETECYLWLCQLSHIVKFLAKHSTKKSAKKLMKNVFDLFSANPGVPFYGVPEHRSYHDMPRWMQDFCVERLSCSGRRWTGRPRNLLLCCKQTGSQTEFAANLNISQWWRNLALAFALDET
jgi:hypothetical protein